MTGLEDILPYGDTMVEVRAAANDLAGVCAPVGRPNRSLLSESLRTMR